MPIYQIRLTRYCSGYEHALIHVEARNEDEARREAATQRVDFWRNGLGHAEPVEIDFVEEVSE